MDKITFTIDSSDHKLADIQADVNDIMSDVGRHFDDIAEYMDTVQADPLHHIDIDEELHFNTEKIVISKPVQKPTLTRHIHQQVAHRSYPDSPKKVIMAMPLELQMQMRYAPAPLSFTEKVARFLRIIGRRLKF